MKQPFAVFAIIEFSDNTYGVTTRPDGGIGFPGGKIDKGETPYDALYRECLEEGWQLSSGVIPIEIHSQDVNGKPITWFYVRDGAVRFSADETWKEKYRGIHPIICTEEQIIHSGMGNDIAIQKLKTWKQS